MRGISSTGIPQYIQGHKSLLNKGKTYKEIYGTDNPGCGYQKGENNIATRSEIREKISKGVIKSYHNPETGEALRNLRREACPFLQAKFISYERQFLALDGNKFRSRFELAIADLFYTNNIPYRDEVRYKLDNNGLKVVDFVVGDLLIEVTGYAYDEWRQKFNEKIMRLHNIRPENILVIMANIKEKYLKEFEDFVSVNKLKRITVIPFKNTDKILEYVYDQQTI